MDHRSEPHSRTEDWLQNLPAGGIRSMCRWERFCTFAREPERRKVAIDARVTVDGTPYEVDSELAGEDVVLWWGLFDQELFVEHGEKRFGPYLPVGGPIPLNRYRAFKKSSAQRRADRIELLAAQLELPRAALESRPDIAVFIRPGGIPAQTFTDPDPFNQLTYPSTLAAKRAISEFLGLPLAKLPADQLARIEELVQSTLNKQEVLAQVRACIEPDERLPENQPHAE